MKLQLQIFLLVLATSAALLVTLAIVLPGRVEPYLVERLATELKQEALLVRDTLERFVRSEPEIHNYANQIGAILDRRITVIAPDGRILGDNSAASAQMENHNGRPEVQQARSNGYGRSIRPSQTLGTEMLYVAVPFRTPSAEMGVVRLSLDYQVIRQSGAEMRHVIYWLSLVAFSITAALAYFLSHRFSLSAAEMARSAHRVASGDLEARAPIRGSLELRTLGRAFNGMTERLISQIRDGAAERQKLQAILEGMREGVLMTDPRGKVEFMNPSCYEMFSLKHPAEGRRLSEVVRQSDLAKAVQQAVASRESQQLEIELHAARKILLASLHPVLQEDRAKGVVVVFLDVTELRRLESVRKDFVANVSHELRTPLTSIQGYAETLLEHPHLDAPIRDNFISIIDKQARWLTNLIEDLLKLSSLESGRAEAETETVDIAEVAQSVTVSMQNLFDAKSITCTCEANGNAKARANRRGVEQILYNLLDNTLKYTPQGGSVQVRVGRNEDRVEIAVQDTGIGIPAEDVPRIFERFYRVDRSRSRKLGGTGLGLAIVKHVLQQQGGTIRVESRLDEGSTFIFQLPAA